MERLKPPAFVVLPLPRRWACVLVLARSISMKYSNFTVSVLRRAVRSVVQTSASAGTTGEPVRSH